MVTTAGKHARLLDYPFDPFEEAEKHIVRRPPPIVEWAERADMLARPPLYPRQKTLLRLMFLETETMTEYDKDVIGRWTEKFYSGDDRVGVSPDVWERIRYLKEHGYEHFREVVFIGGRRCGKGYIGAIALSWMVARLLYMYSPQVSLGIDPSKELQGLIVATNFQQAKDYLFADVYNAIVNSPWFQPYIASAKGHRVTFWTSADRERITRLRMQGLLVEKEMTSVSVQAVTSNAKAGRGMAAYAAAFDEMAHMMYGTAGPRTGDEVYNAITPALDQMGRHAFVYVPTSPYTKVGKAYDLYNLGLERDEDGNPTHPDILVIQLPSWGPYEDAFDLEATEGRVFVSVPQAYDEVMRRIERRDPASFRVERLAQWAEVQDAYLAPSVVDAMFEPFIDPVTGERRELGPTTVGILAHRYRAHADPSKSQHNFALCIGHTERFTSEDGQEWDHVVIDLLHVWKPEDFPDHQIQYDQVQEALVDLIVSFPSMEVFSVDQYGSFATVSMLKRRLRERGSRTKVHEVVHTQASRQQMWERLKSALGMGWVHAYRDDFFDGQSLLEHELKFLQVVNGKVKKQDFGPVQTDDLADAFCVVVSELLSDQLERLERRENLARARIMPGAEGGYHTPEFEKLSSARAVLRRYAAPSGFGYGVRRRT